MNELRVIHELVYNGGLTEISCSGTANSAAKRRRTTDHAAAELLEAHADESTADSAWIRPADRGIRGRAEIDNQREAGGNGKRPTERAGAVTERDGRTPTNFEPL